MRLPTSIRWRLQLWLAFLLVGLLSGFGLTAFQLYRTNRLSQIDAELEQRVAALAGDLRRPPEGPPPFPVDRGDAGEPFRRGEPWLPPRFDRGWGAPRMDKPGPRAGLPGEPFDRWLTNRTVDLSPPTQALFDETATNGFYYAIWFRGDLLLKRSTNAPPDLQPPRPVVGENLVRTGYRATNREAFLVTERGDCVLVGRSVLADLAALGRFAGWLVGAGLAVAVIGLGGGWAIVTRAIRPVEAISAAASRIAAGNLAERIPISEADSELGRLAGVLNNTFSRLDDAFAQQRQFTADASHELRTPIAVLLSETQTALKRERSPAEYRETIEVCQDTAQRMRRLTESLLELARFDAGQETMRREPQDLAELARDCAEAIRPLARDRQITVCTELAPTPVEGDGDRLRQVILNLLTNAIHYNREGGEVRLATVVAEERAKLDVQDTGPGIAPEDLPRVFNRFYRADPARARSQGRAGLGLAISKAIVDAHEGSLEVESQVGVGSTFTLTLPVAQRQ